MKLVTANEFDVEQARRDLEGGFAIRVEPEDSGYLGDHEVNVAAVFEYAVNAILYQCVALGISCSPEKEKKLWEDLQTALVRAFG